MPELPEVETIRRDLEIEVVGRRITAVDVTGFRSIRRHLDVHEFESRLIGRRIAWIGRTGKYLRIGLDGGNVLVVHLGMSGQLLVARQSRDPVVRHTHVVLTLSGGGQLRFVDPRTFGELFVSSADGHADRLPELVHLGFDPIDDALGSSAFSVRLTRRRAALKTLLMDQRFVAGIGNIYSDEILFAARLRYDRKSDSLGPGETRRLYRSMVRTLTEAIEHRGSSLADRQYRDVFGQVGEYQRRHRVYDREGEGCHRCRRPIVRVKVNGRSTFFCERCQV
jgi:formamidopyrimidine-DNA glycosylase